MKQYDAKNILNIALAGHAGCGKTSLAESMLYLAKHMNIYKKGDSPHAENPSPYTFPANKPSTEIDYICSFDPQQKIKLTSHYTKHAPVESDHAPIVAWLEIK